MDVDSGQASCKIPRFQIGAPEMSGNTTDTGNPLLNLIRYWRRSLSDSVVDSGIQKDKKQSPLVKLSREELNTGVLNEVTMAGVEKLFAKAYNKAEKRLGRKSGSVPDRIPVSLWPIVAARRTSGGSTIRDGKPQLVLPIATRATIIAEHRSIWPEGPRIPRDILEPLAENSFSIGKVSDLDDFLAAEHFDDPGEGETHAQYWNRYLEYCESLLRDVTDNWPVSDDQYVIRESEGWLLISPDSDGTVSNILCLYDNILNERDVELPLLRNLIVPGGREPSPVLAPPFDLAGRLGHGNSDFPLADGQRDVLAHLAVSGENEIIAVNGPPGTGKTTMLLSAIAGEWVRAARAGGDPPVIVAASANNQAVTNIIDAFAKDFSAGEGRFAGRWLPDIDTYGLYLVAHSRQKDVSDKYLVPNSCLETGEYVERATAAYLEAAGQAFPQLETVDLEKVVQMLQGEIAGGITRLEAVDAKRKFLTDAQARVLDLLGEHPKQALTKLESDRIALERKASVSRELLDAWDGYLGRESFLLSLLDFLPPIRQRRLARARSYLRSKQYGGDLYAFREIRDVARELQEHADASEREHGMASSRLDQCRKTFAGFESTLRIYRKSVRRLGSSIDDPEDFDALDKAMDCTVRFDLFRLATHYWEGRWLLQMHELMPDIAKEMNKQLRKDAIRNWRARMMLTPCMVSTFATLPGRMISFENHVEHQLYNFIDLLIVDEAGQTLPEVAGASFALSKKAMVIGDIRQIEPIVKLRKSVDIGNLVDCGVLAEDIPEDDLDRLDGLGVTSTAGSAMRVAQGACKYHPQADLDRGLYLFEHYRCFDEIISFCSDLCYRGRLHPERGPSPHLHSDGSGGKFRPMSYLHIEGRCSRYGNARVNTVEAKTIAKWLQSQHETIENAYGKELKDVVGVITPFRRQVQEIHTALEHVYKKKGMSHVDTAGITVGTVHALQGADRPIVIFSPTYSKHENGGFIDMSPSMLNVAVSRARDSFMVFGDMDLFSNAQLNTPRRKPHNCPQLTQ